MGKNLVLKGVFDDKVEVNAQLSVNTEKGLDGITVDNKPLSWLVERTSEGEKYLAKDKIVYRGEYIVQTTPDGIEKYYYSSNVYDLITQFQDTDKLSEIGELVFEADYAAPLKLPCSIDMVFDLNGHTISTTHGDFAIEISNGASVVIKNGYLNAKHRGIKVSDGSLVLKDFHIDINAAGTNSARGVEVAVYESENYMAQPIFIMDRRSSILIHGGIHGGETGVFMKAAFTSRLPSGADASKCKSPLSIINGKISVESTLTNLDEYSYGLVDNGSASPVGVNWIVNRNAVISVDHGVGIHRAANGELVLNGGVVTGTMAGIVCRAGKLTVPSFSTVEVFGVGEHNAYAPGHFSGMGCADFAMGDALSLELNTSYSDGNLSASVDGGSFASINGNPIGSYRHTKAKNAAFYSEQDLADGIRLNNGELGEVGKLYAIIDGANNTDHSRWTWDSTPINGDDGNFMARVEGFVSSGVKLNKTPSTEGYVNLTGENASNGIIKTGVNWNNIWNEIINWFHR